MSLGTACFVVDGVRATTRVSTADKNSHVDCHLCGTSVLLTQMRPHTGRHIIRHLYGMDESDLKQGVCATQAWYRLQYANNAFRSATTHVDFVVEVNVRQQ